MVLIAAAGNFGPKSPPQYPAADPNVIAVSATDADDKMFTASNIGPHVAVAAPGVDILLPAPDSDYQLISGTSFSAAHVSGIAALMLERKPRSHRTGCARSFRTPPATSVRPARTTNSARAWSTPIRRSWRRSRMPPPGRARRSPG